MNQSKFSLADLLTVLGTLGFGFFCFLSLNFLSLGKIVPSILWAAVLALILGGLAFGAKLLKKTSRNFKTCIIWEWILLFLFVVVAFVAISPFSHYFTVLDQKADIQSRVTSTITQAEGMFADYENYANNRMNIYKSRLNSVVAARSVNPSEYRNYGFVDGTDDITQVENKMFTLRVQLYPSNYEEMKKADYTWLVKVKNIVGNSWKFTFGIVEVVNNVESNITSRKNEIKQFSQFRALGEKASDFDYSLTFDDVTDKITELGSFTIVSIAIAISLYVLMWLPWSIQDRSTKSSYSLFSFLKDKTSKKIDEFTINY